MTLKLAASDDAQHPRNSRTPESDAVIAGHSLPMADPPNIAPSEAPIAAEAAEDDGRIPVTVRLTPFHLDYLQRRAARNGNAPERELETILRTFRAHHDTERYGLDTAPRGPGMAAGTRRA